MSTSYSLSTYTIKLTVNGSSQPVLQVITRSGETVMESLNLSTQGGEVHSEDNSFYIVGCTPIEEQFVNTVDPSSNTVFLSTGAKIMYINGSNIDLDSYNAYLGYSEGEVAFYEQPKEQCYRKVG